MEELIDKLKVELIEALNLEEITPEDIDSEAPLFGDDGLGLDSIDALKEVHLYIPTDDYQLPAKQGKNVIKPCYLDIKSGFINFKDDSQADKPGVRKLYYCNYSAKGKPQIVTFTTCPHCRHQLSSGTAISL